MSFGRIQSISIPKFIKISSAFKWLIGAGCEKPMMEPSGVRLEKPMSTSELG